MTSLVREALALQELDAGSNSVVASGRRRRRAQGRESWWHRSTSTSDDEAWYVLDGTLGFSFDGVESFVSNGGAALAGPASPTPTGTRPRPRRVT